jgi:hypothetical protein
MGVQLIFKKTRRERESGLRASRSQSNQRGIEGRVRTTEEAFEISRQREREGLPFDKPYAVSGDAPESKIAEGEVLIRAGLSPDWHGYLESPSTRHDG